MRPRRDAILALVAAEYRFPVQHITSTMRFPVYVEARATYMHAARAFGYSLNQIAEVVCRDHATVQHNLKKDPASLPKFHAVMSRLTRKEAA